MTLFEPPAPLAARMIHLPAESWMEVDMRSAGIALIDVPPPTTPTL